MGKIHKPYSLTFKAKGDLEAIRKEEKNLFIEGFCREIGEFKVGLDRL